MRHNTSARRLLGIFLATLIIFPNLLIAPARAASAAQQTQILLYGFVKNQFGAPVPGALVVIGGAAAGGIATDANGYFSFTLFAGCSTLYELRAYVNNTQAGGVASLNNGCFYSDHAIPDFIYNASASNGKVAYNKWGAVNASPEDGVYLMNADGTGDSKIPGSERDYTPVWSPDGTRIAFRTLRGGGIDIVNADGTGRIDLTNDPGYYTHPKWQSVDVPPSADMGISAWNDPRYVSSNGGQVIYFVTVFNNGPATATNITLAGQMPAGVTLNTILNDNGDGSTCASAPDGASFSCTFPTANLYDAKPITLLATSNAAGAPNAPVTATFNVTSDTPDSDPGSNATTTDFFIAPPPLPTPTPGPAAADAQIAYQATSFLAQSEIFLRRADGTGFVNLSNDPEQNSEFVWSPDGNRLAFLRHSPDDNSGDIYTINPDGSNPVRVTDTPGASEGWIAWSPDGSRIAVHVSTDGGYTSEIFAFNADGTGGRTRLTAPGLYAYEPRWSPDGSRVAFTGSAYDATLGSISNIYTVNADGSNQTRFDHEHSVTDRSPSWSPDGSRLAFERASFTPDMTWQTDIYAANPDGSNLVNVSNDGVSSGLPYWSPDGSRISFTTFHNGCFALATANPDGANRLILYNPTNGSFGGAARWSPDGSKLVFDYIVGEAIRAGIYVVNANGTELVALGDESEINSAPDWSPDGERVVFTTQRNGSNAINIINADGTGRVALPTDTGHPAQPKWRPHAAPQNNTPTGTNVAVDTGSGVRLSFSNVTGAGQTTVTPIDPNSLQGIPGQYVINADSLAFEITTTATYTGPITIGFNVPGITNPITFSTLRVLHGEPPPLPNFVDRTVLAPDSPTPNFPARTVYARVSSLNPFIVAERVRDNVAPVTTATLPAQPNAAGWHKANVTVSLAATDNAGGSGVKSITYSTIGAQAISQATVNGSAANITVATQGTTIITYRAQDADGNVEQAKSVTVKLDKTAPATATSTVNSTPHSSGYYNGLNGPVAVTLSANDLPGGNASGIAGFLVSATGAQTIPANTFVPASNPVVQITTDGTTALSYRAVDNAGNEGTSASRTLKVDATAPTTSYAVAGAGKNITLTVGFHDNLSGYAAVNYSVNDGQWQSYTGPFPSSGNFSYAFNGPYHESGSYTIKYYGTDKAGNKETTRTVTFTIPPQAITPTLANVKRNSNGTYTATFGYRNDNPVTFNIAVGASNSFSPGNQNRGQVTAFQTGTVASAFTVTWDGSSLTWKIKAPDGQTRQVTARKP